METIMVDKQINIKVKKVSKNLGISTQAFTTNAILFYIQNISKKLDLKEELSLWENASNADLVK